MTKASGYSVVSSDRLDPYWNLALEEILLDRAAGNPPVLFLWRSRPAVIIGKNQNPWRECNLSWMRDHGVWLARRLSGGGAVYHDEGNLNYAFFMPREQYHEAEVYQTVLRALSLLNIRAERLNRNSLAVDGFKVSGNAFCFRRNAAMHHGTLLVSADLDRLRQALTPWSGVIHTKAIASIPSPVTNLCALDTGITISRVRDALATACVGSAAAPGPDDREVERAVARYRSAEWLYDQTPVFDIELGDGRFTVEKGRVVAVRASDPAREATLTREWMGQPFEFTAERLTPGTGLTAGI